ncbi:MAG: hypothetical protein M1831_001761 [Alyxoria varia]|nr:MAG: hypothetical protein M1831_001761 [Alyxoria varia]
MSVQTDLSWPAIHQLMVAEQACAGVFLTLAVFFTGLRLASKWMRERRCWGWDDGMIPVALVCYFVFIICRVLQVKAEEDSRNPDNHVVEESDEWWHYQYISSHCAYLGLPFYLLSIYFARLSVCFLFLRILAGQKSRRATQIIAIWLTVSSIPFFVVSWMPCFPVRRYFEPEYPGHCINYAPYFQAIRATNLTTDIFLLLVPIPTLWNIQARTSFKVGLIFTFATASIGIGSCLGSLIFFVRNPEATWDKYVIANTLSVLEISMYIVAANLPPCRGLFTRMASSNWTAGYFSSKSFFPVARSGDSASQDTARRGLSHGDIGRIGSEGSGETKKEYMAMDFVKHGDIEANPQITARTTVTAFPERKEFKCPNCQEISTPTSP